MRIAYLSPVDVDSAAIANYRETVTVGILRSNGHEVFPIVPAHDRPHLGERLWLEAMFRCGIRSERSLTVLRQTARTIQRRLAEICQSN